MTLEILFSLAISVLRKIFGLTSAAAFKNEDLPELHGARGASFFPEVRANDSSSHIAHRMCDQRQYGSK